MKYDLIRAVLENIVGENNEVMYDAVDIYINRGLFRSIIAEKICFVNGRFEISYKDSFEKPATTYLYVEDIETIYFSDDTSEIKFTFKDDTAKNCGRETFLLFTLDKN